MHGQDVMTGAVVALSVALCAGHAHTQEPASATDQAISKPAPVRLITETRTTPFGQFKILAYTEDPTGARTAAEEAFDVMQKLLSQMGDADAASDISRLNLAAGQEAISVSSDTLEVLEKGKEIGALTGGAFAVTWAPLASAWNFSPGTTSVPKPGHMLQRAGLVDDTKLVLTPSNSTAQLQSKGMAVGVDRLARGYALDRGAAALVQRGFKNILLVAGSDMVARGDKGIQPWLVGLQDPRASGYFATVPIADEAVATAGDFQEYIEVGSQRFHSVLDPRTGYPARGCRSVTVVAKDAVVAQALAPALVVMGAEAALALVEKMEDVDAAIVSQGNEVTLSSGVRDRTRLVRPPTP